MLLQNQEAKDFSGLLSTLQVFSHQPLQANYPCTPAQLFPLLRKIHHETTRQGALGSGSQEARCSDLTLAVQRALAGVDLGLPQFPLL